MKRITIRRRTLVLLILILIAAIVSWGVARRAQPPQIPFVKVVRETVTSTLSTNGKVEPIQWASARAERSGVIKAVFVQRGQQVAEGTQLVALDTASGEAELASAEAQILGARAQEKPLQQGGSAVERAEINSQLAKAQLDLDIARRDLGVAQRLYEKQAGTKTDVEAAQARVNALQEQIHGLENRRASLVEPSQKQAVQAKLLEAEAAAELARHNLALSVIKAPIGGTIYQFDQRVGGYVNVGDVIASIGRLEQVRVIVYIDEPDLGRVGKGMAVTITWEAMPGRVWKGVVDKLPTQVIQLAGTTRQVGEVSCIVQNPDRDLLPGTNIDASIVASVVDNALVIPKEVLRREGSQSGVYLLGKDDRLEFRPVQLGVSSVTKAQVKHGIEQGESVALPTERPIKVGQKVEPVYPQ